VNAQSINPTIDAIQEFRIESNSSAAEYGRAAAQINVATRSGTNQFHGSAYEFLRNDVFDARNFFDSTGIIPPLRQNTFGATAGGRVIRDKTFFFLSYDGLRVRRGTTLRGIIPPAAFLNGDFSSLSRQLTDPNRNPLPGNRVPASSIDPKAKALLGFYPQLNFTDPVFNYITVTSSKESSDQGIARIDHQFSSADLLFVRISLIGGNAFAPGVFPVGIGGVLRETNGKNIGASYSRVFSANKTNLFRAGYNRSTLDRTPEGFEQDFPAAVKPPALQDQRFGFTGFSITGYTGIAFGDRWIRPPDAVYQVSDNFSWITGAHTLKFGFDMRRWHNDRAQNFAHAAGFDGRFTGNPVADMLYGVQATSSINPATQDGNLRRWDMSYFMQDDWRVSQTLTLNLGLRYEYAGPLSDANDNLLNFDFATGTVINVGPGYPSGHNRTFRDLNNFGPRFGLAWSPEKLRRTVFRLSYGFYYVPAEGQADLLNGPKNPPRYSFTGDVNNPDALTFKNPAPINSIVGGFPMVSSVDLHIRTPYVQQWSFTIQREVAGNILLEAGYIGNKGTKLWTIGPANTPLPAAGPIQPRRPYPTFGSIELNDDNNTTVYHGLQTKVEKRYGSGLSLLASYTWSKAIDFNSFLGVRLYNPFNLGQDRGLADHDVRHRFVTGWIYELPFGRGKPWLSSAGTAGNLILGGWSVGSITLFQSGTPFTVTATGDPGNWGQGTRPNVIGNSGVDNPTLARWFNTSAFVAPAPFTIGNVSRNSMVGPGLNNWDIIVTKYFDIREGHRLQLRGELYNAFNHASFNNPGASLGTTTFGVISSATPGRIVQLGLKYNF
jgi:hypothetical protein